jgi:hypothetical protein
MWVVEEKLHPFLSPRLYVGVVRSEYLTVCYSVRNVRRKPGAFRIWAEQLSSALLRFESWSSAINISATWQYNVVGKSLLVCVAL